MQAAAEWEEAPAGFFEAVIEYRSYAAAYQVVRRAEKRSDIPTTPLTQMVQRIEFDLAQQEIDEGKADEEGE